LLTSSQYLPPPPEVTTLPPDPEIIVSKNRNITVLAGKNANITCSVSNLGLKSVSWIRHSDTHILTFGRHTYTSDDRFRTVNKMRDNSVEDWILNILSVQKRDSGQYECQVSTQPIKSYIVYLNVLAPVASIVNGVDIYANKGSMINITCKIEKIPQSPEDLTWYHDNKIVSFDSDRGGVTILTERENDVTVSTLLLRDAAVTDSGKYVCSAKHVSGANTKLHVMAEDNPAAMKSDSVNNKLISLLVFLPTLSSFLVRYKQVTR